MKIAVVHELLTMKGGAEKVLRIIAEMFPDAPIYTLLYDEKKMSDWFPRERVRPSVLQPNFPFSIFHFSFNHHLWLSRFPAATESWDFSGYDLVISSSSAFVHGIITNSAPKHLCYVHSPARYLWDRTHDVLARARWWQRPYLSRLFHRLRIWDTEAADRPDVLLAASKEVQRRIELYWRRESEVLYPPIDDFWLNQQLATSNNQKIASCQLSVGSYYLIVSQLAHYKRIDLAIRACNQRKTPLIIAGVGPARASLEKLSGPTVTFVGYKTEPELRGLYANARATIFPGEEDFGLVPLESMACGTPVIAYRGGGALETIVEGKTGVFFENATPASLMEAMERCESSSFQTDECRARASEFSRARFEEALRRHVDALGCAV